MLAFGSASVQRCAIIRKFNILCGLYCSCLLVRVFMFFPPGPNLREPLRELSACEQQPNHHEDSEEQPCPDFPGKVLTKSDKFSPGKATESATEKCV